MDLRQEWATPEDLWQGLHREFQFTLDAAADAGNAKTLDFWSKTINGLAQDWHPRHRIWCNPPYAEIAPWVDKAIAAAEKQGTLSVLLLPARVEQRWFRSCLHNAVEIAFFTSRLQFAPPRDVKASSNREASILAVFGPTKYGRRETLRDSKTGTVIHSWDRA